MTTPSGMQWRAIENAFCALIKEACGIPSVWTQGKGPQPDRPYARLQWLSFGNIGDSGYAEEFNASTGKVERSYYASRTAQVDIQVITDELRADKNSMSYVDAISTVLDIAEAAQRWLAPVGVAVSDFSGARNLDAVEDGAKPVSRTSLTVNLNIAVNVDAAFTVPPIETVQGTGQVLGGVKPDNGGAFTVEGESE